MGEAKAKRERQLVSVLIPERGRPEMLERLINSLIDTAGDDHNYEILVQYDDDDPVWEGKTPPAHERVAYYRKERPITLGEKLNQLARIAAGDILFFIANDMVMDTHGWPAKFRQACYKLPNGMGVPFVKDALHPGHSSYWLMTRRMYDVVGMFAAPWWPFWFIDTWQQEVGLLLGVYFEIDVAVSAPEGRGKTHGLVDLPFWCQFFEETRPMRLRDAIRIAEEAYGNNSSGFAEVMSKIGERQAYCAGLTRHHFTPEFQAQWGGTAESDPSPKYAYVKDYAERQMQRLRAEAPRRPRIAVAIPSGRAIEATTTTNIAALTAYSSLNGIEVAIVNVQSSDVAHGRNETVRLAREHGCVGICWFDSDMRFPVDTLVRLMKWDKPIVGALYHKRVRNSQGVFELLGKLKGPKPEVMTDGLHEALLMPGGVMYVAMEVYDKLGFPAYSFAYRWPGDDGLEAFKRMLCGTLWEAPPEDVLADMANTKFGEWLRTGYVIGEYGEMCHEFSEDLMFCRRARKAGYQIFADIGLSAQVAHLGEIAVDMKLGPEVQRLPNFSS